MPPTPMPQQSKYSAAFACTSKLLPAVLLATIFCPHLRRLSRGALAAAQRLAFSSLKFASQMRQANLFSHWHLTCRCSFSLIANLRSLLTLHSSNIDNPLNYSHSSTINEHTYSIYKQHTKQTNYCAKPLMTTNTKTTIAANYTPNTTRDTYYLSIS